MENKIKNIIAAAVVLFAAVAAPVFAGGDLPRYAPPGTSLILSPNLAKMTGTKVFKAFRKTIVFEDLVRENQAAGVDIDKVLRDGDICLFFDLNAFIAGKGVEDTVIYRGSQAEALFKKRLKKAEKQIDEAKKKVAQSGKGSGAAVPRLSAEEVDGRPAFVISGERSYRIELMADGNTIQWSEAVDRAKLITTPLKKNADTELTREVDSSALLSIVWKANIPKELFKEDGSTPVMFFFKNLMIGLNFATLNVRDSGEFLEVRLTGRYDSEDAAKNARESLNSLREFFKSHLRERDPEGAAIFESIAISCEGKIVNAMLKYRQDELAASIEKMDKKAREQRQKGKAPKKNRGSEPPAAKK